NLIIRRDETILVTGAAGFIGSRVVESLLAYGFTSITCLIRTANGRDRLMATLRAYPDARVRIVEGNLLSRDDCRIAAAGASVVYHLAAGTEKTFAGCF